MSARSLSLHRLTGGREEADIRYRLIRGTAYMRVYTVFIAAGIPVWGRRDALTAWRTPHSTRFISDIRFSPLVSKALCVCIGSADMFLIYHSHISVYRHKTHIGRSLVMDITVTVPMCVYWFKSLNIL